jgi:hypothetical protein
MLMPFQQLQYGRHSKAKQSDNMRPQQRLLPYDEAGHDDDDTPVAKVANTRCQPRQVCN